MRPSLLFQGSPACTQIIQIYNIYKYKAKKYTLFIYCIQTLAKADLINYYATNQQSQSQCAHRFVNSTKWIYGENVQLQRQKRSDSISMLMNEKYPIFHVVENPQQKWGK